MIGYQGCKWVPQWSKLIKTTLRKKSNKASRSSRDSWSHLCWKNGPVKLSWSNLVSICMLKDSGPPSPFCKSCLLVFWVTKGIKTQKLFFLLWLNTTPVLHTGFIGGGGGGRWCWQWKWKVGSYEVMPMFCLLFIHYNSWSVLRKKWRQKDQLKVSSSVWALVSGSGFHEPQEGNGHLCIINLLWIKTTLGPKENCLTTERINAWCDGRDIGSLYTTGQCLWPVQTVSEERLVLSPLWSSRLSQQ